MTDFFFLEDGSLLNCRAVAKIRPLGVGQGFELINYSNVPIGESADLAVVTASDLAKVGHPATKRQETDDNWK